MKLFVKLLRLYFFRSLISINGDYFCWHYEKKESSKNRAAGKLVDLAYQKKVKNNKERIVLVHLSSLANQECICWASVRTISINTGINKSDVRDALVSLCRQKVLRLREIKDDNTCVFRLII